MTYIRVTCYIWHDNVNIRKNEADFILLPHNVYTHDMFTCRMLPCMAYLTEGMLRHVNILL